MPRLITTTIIAIMVMVHFVSLTQAQEPFEYVSPPPQAEFVSTQTTLAVRHGDDISADTINDKLFTVTSQPVDIKTSVNGTEAGYLFLNRGLPNASLNGAKPYIFINSSRV